MRIRHYDAFARAKVLLSLGYPHAHVAREVGAHRNSVLAWARELGYSASSGDSARSRRVTAAFRKIQRLGPADRKLLYSMLSKRKLMGRA